MRRSWLFVGCASLDVPLGGGAARLWWPRTCLNSLDLAAANGGVLGERGSSSGTQRGLQVALNKALVATMRALEWGSEPLGHSTVCQGSSASSWICLDGDLDTALCVACLYVLTPTHRFVVLDLSTAPRRDLMLTGSLRWSC
jgi:hypothetical protein